MTQRHKIASLSDAFCITKGLSLWITRLSFPVRSDQRYTPLNAESSSKIALIIAKCVTKWCNYFPLRHSSLALFPTVYIGKVTEWRIFWGTFRWEGFRHLRALFERFHKRVLRIDKEFNFRKYEQAATKRPERVHWPFRPLNTTCGTWIHFKSCRLARIVLRAITYSHVVFSHQWENAKDFRVFVRTSKGIRQNS